MDPNQTGHYTVLARAIDDSINLEHPQLSSNFAITDFYRNFSVAEVGPMRTRFAC